ncbi:MAG: electron transfer flavoprotein alpha/ beta subunit [Chloroflexi bacterium]|nr:electron transfer flavoprotein alpha/ beta subunit [Chloroflexota bacterium]
MKIIVAIKQVPFVDQLKFDHENKCLIRDGVESEINPFDKRALTRAIQLKQEFGGEVVVVTMGPPQAKDALIEALAMGADRAVHLLGREFARADTLATARALALACRQIGFDLIFCGKYSTDAETAQVPAMLAEFLDVPQVTAVTGLQISDKTITAVRETDAGLETVECELPAVLSAAERLVKPLKVAPGQLEQGTQKPLQVISPADLSTDMSQFGLAGSPTWVSEIYSIAPQRKRIVCAADQDVNAVAQQVVQDLLAEGLFGEWKSKPRVSIAPKPRQVGGTRPIWVVAELAGHEIRPVTLELLGRAVQLANEFDGEVAAVLLGHDVGAHAQTLAAYGADTIYLADAPALATYSTETFTAILADAIRQHDPYAVLIPSTSQGRDLAPRVAARLEMGLTGDCIGLEIDGEGRLVQLKPAFGGNIVAPILSKTRPAMATVRPGMLQTADPDVSRRFAIEPLPTANVIAPRVRVISAESVARVGVELDSADVIVGVGTGIGGPENLPRVQELADALSAPIGGTRKVVDAGWLPRQAQIGLTGRSIAPRLYVAIGIGGKFNHTVGIQRSGLILAINNNPEAEIFKQCDYGIVGDWGQVVAALTQQILQARRKP